MSVEVLAQETSEPPRVGPARWGRLIPYLVLISVVAMFVFFSKPNPALKPSPEPVVEIPIPRPPALSDSEAKDLRDGFWSIEELWLDRQLAYSHGLEMQRFHQIEEPLRMMYARWTARLTQNTLEVTSQRTERVGDTIYFESKPRLTQMVFITRFDPEGMGTVDALPISWNEEKGDVLNRIDAGESLKGLYEIEELYLWIYIPANADTPRLRQIPDKLSLGDRLFKLSRYSTGPRSEENDVRSYYPPTWAEIYDWKTKMYNSDGSIISVTDDRHYAGPQFNRIPVPYSTPIEKFVDPAHTKNVFLIHHTNGWIVQTAPLPEPPPPPRILPDDAP